MTIKEGIDTTDDSAAAKLFRRMILANGTHQTDSTSERIKVGQERAGAKGRRPGRPPALSPEQVDLARQLYAENHSISHTARLMKVAQGTIKKAVESAEPSGHTGNHRFLENE